jgi:hypothetical protein
MQKGMIETHLPLQLLSCSDVISISKQLLHGVTTVHIPQVLVQRHLLDTRAGYCKSSFAPIRMVKNWNVR